ncbi:MAG: FAD-binding oxidoreductase [Chloroflexi bacterium]|nr:FAD-binding oxidoreductase [Chloroflexota bacterium]
MNSRIDWRAVRAALGDVPVLDRPAVVRQRSRDFYWYSPLLRRALDGCCAELVAQPRSEAELAQCLSVAYTYRVPIVLRGGGTGNYGQAVPLEGGMIIETLGLDQVAEIGPGMVRVAAGCKIGALNAALRATGAELPIFPSTQDMATIGGFIAGGSAGIGSLRHGMLRDPGNIIALTALSVETTPRRHTFRGAATELLHHAWGINGAIVELTLRTAPLGDWMQTITSFETYGAAFAAGATLGARTDLRCKLVTTLDARIVPYFNRLREYMGADRAVMLGMIERADVPAYRQLMDVLGGRVEFVMDDAQREAEHLPHVFEFSYNHTTAQVLKVDKSATYLQVLVAAPLDAGRIVALQRLLGDDVLMHHEFSRLDGQLVAFDIPIVHYRSDERLAEIMACYEAEGFPVSNPHTYIIEDGGMKRANYRHLALKRELDPRGLLNSGKSREWARVRHLDPAAIRALEG